MMNHNEAIIFNPKTNVRSTLVEYGSVSMFFVLSLPKVKKEHLEVSNFIQPIVTGMEQIEIIIGNDKDKEFVAPIVTA